MNLMHGIFMPRTSLMDLERMLCTYVRTYVRMCVRMFV